MKPTRVIPIIAVAVLAVAAFVACSEEKKPHAAGEVTSPPPRPDPVRPPPTPPPGQGNEPGSLAGVATDGGGATGTTTAATGGGVGSVEGEVVFNGKPPEMQPLKRGADPICAKKEMKDESVMVSGGKLQNVVVRVSGTVPAGTPAKTDAVVVDQQDCMYRPRVVTAMAGQPVMIRNSDGTMHNVHSYAGTKTLFNAAQPPKAPDLSKTFDANTGVIKLKCDVHPWMTGWIVVSGHPFSAVTGADGKFTLKDLPAGSYTLEAWHEKLGTQTANVTVEAGKPAQVSFTYAGS
jgi:plastocyanin